VLYAKNTFSYDSLAPLISHLLNIPSRRIPLMRDVQWRKFSSAEEWSERTPWLDCRKTVNEAGERTGEDVVGAGCACFRCWPKQIWTDTESHHWLRYCWLMRTVEDNTGVPRSVLREEGAGYRYQ